MIKSIGWNVHASYCSDQYWDTLISWWKLNPPAALLIIDSFGNKENGDLKIVWRALQAERELPETTIILRRYLTGDNYWRDQGDVKALTAQDWIDNHIDIRNTRIYASILNEPDYPGSIGWTVQTMKAALKAGIRVSIGGYNTGSPRVEDIHYARPILEEMAKPENDGRCLLDLHEYGPPLWMYDIKKDAYHPDQWVDKVDVPLWHWGRYRWWLKYCDDNKIKRPKIVIGETAFGLRVPEYDNAFTIYECANVWRGWGYQNWQEYGAMQMKALWNAVYRHDPEVVALCYFCINDQTDNWKDFNIHNAPQFFLSVSEGFEKMSEEISNAPYAAGTYRATMTTGDVLRVRNMPTTIGSVVVGEIKTGDIVEINSNSFEENNQYIWQSITVNGKIGWAAVSVKSLKLELIRESPRDVLLKKISEIENSIKELKAIVSNLT